MYEVPCIIPSGGLLGCRTVEDCRGVEPFLLESVGMGSGFGSASTVGSGSAYGSCVVKPTVTTSKSVVGLAMGSSQNVKWDFHPKFSQYTRSSPLSVVVLPILLKMFQLWHHFFVNCFAFWCQVDPTCRPENFRVCKSLDYMYELQI